MWIKEVLLAIVGFSGGVTVAGGLFAFIAGLGVVSDFAERTHTGSAICFYEDCLVVGGIVGNLLFLYQPKFQGTLVLLGFFGLFSGIFVGCWAMALAETLKVFPIFMRRMKIIRGLSLLIVGMALGRMLGGIIYFWNGW